MLSHFPNLYTKSAFVSVATLALSFVAVALISVSVQVGQLAPGFVVWDNLVVPAVTSSGGTDGASVPLRATITAVDGASVVDAGQLRSLVRAAPPGTTFRYRYLHDGKAGEVEVRSLVLRWRHVRPYLIPYLLNGVVLFAAALAVFYLRPDLPAAHAFLALAFTFGGMVILALDAFSSFWLERLCFALDSLVPAALLHFALCFPEQRALIRRHRWLLALPYIACVPWAVLQNVYLSGAPERHLQVSGWVYSADAVAALAVVASLVETAWRSRNPVARQQVKAVAAGMTIASVIPALSILATVLYGADVPFNPSTIFLVIFPLSIGYAIARLNLFEVNRFLRLGLVYFTLSILVFAIYALIVLAANSWVERDSPLANHLVPFYLLAIALIVDPLRLQVQRVVDRLFFRQSYNYRATVEETSQALATLLDTNQITSTVLDTAVTVMSIEWGMFVVFRGDEQSDRWFARPAEMAARAEPLHSHPALLRRIAAHDRALSFYELQRQAAAPAELQLLATVETILMVPVAFQRRAVGLLLLGPKKSGVFYSEEDVHLLQTLAHQAALALENAEAYESLRRAQAELVAAERMAAVGELAATVAHGIRNPLAGIRVAAQVAQDEPSDTEAVAESLTDIVSEVDRLEQRVSGILNMARPLEPNLNTHDARRFLESFAANVRHRIPARVQLAIETEADLPPATFDAALMTEVLDVLVNNACEATPAEGTLMLAAQRRDGTVQLVVRDSGSGMDAARLSRIFDLFYTTKATGTGVGLAMAKRLMERQGGSIAVESEPGRGTTFTLSLPRDGR